MSCHAPAWTTPQPNVQGSARRPCSATAHSALQVLSSGNVRPLVVMLTGQQVAWLSKHVAEARAQKADWSMEMLADYLVGRSQTGHQYDVAFYGCMLQHHEVSFQGPRSSRRQGLVPEHHGNMLCPAWWTRAPVPARSAHSKGAAA